MKLGAKARAVREAGCCEDLRDYEIHSDRHGIHKFKARQRVNML